MKKRSKNSFSKKIKKCRFAVNLAVAAIVLAFTIYNMIPKDEKINEVEAQKLADSFGVKF